MQCTKGNRLIQRHSNREAGKGKDIVSVLPPLYSSTCVVPLCIRLFWGIGECNAQARGEGANHYYPLSFYKLHRLTDFYSPHCTNLTPTLTKKGNLECNVLLLVLYYDIGVVQGLIFQKL